jgi:ribosomal-protein-serine acetyltransferase
VGLCSFHPIDKTNLIGNVGYWIDQDFAGKGITTLSAKALVEYGFTKLNLNRIEITCAVENIASQKVAEKNNFKLEGILRQREWLYDHFVDHKVYSLIKSDRPEL